MLEDNFWIFIFSLCLVNAFCADTVHFRSCDKVDFCKRLRSRTTKNVITAKLDSFKINSQSNQGVIDLESDDFTAKLSVQSIEGGLFRIRIEEENSERYRITDVLDPEPTVTSLKQISKDENNIKLGETETSSSTLVINSNPFSLELRNNDEILLSIGDRLFLENNVTSKAFTIDVSFPNSSHIYGAHQHASNIALKTTQVNGADPYRFRNSDNGGYDVDSPMALYGAIPALYGTGPATTSGVFLLNAGEIWVEISRSSDTNVPNGYFIAESGSLDLFLLPGTDLQKIVRQYTQLTGTAHLPQLWTLGFHQSRYSYNDQEDVKTVIKLMDDNDFPVDAIWLDIDYTDDKKYFTWNPDTFSDPVEMQANLSSTNRKLVVIIDPHYKVDDEYSVYANAKNKKYFINKPDGTQFEGSCWPGNSVWLDYLNPEVRQYYADLYSYENFVKTTPTLAGIWNDMNEPAVFTADNDYVNEKTVPFDSVHFGNVQHKDIHNMYGFLQTMATHKGLMQRDPDKRPFILTRSHFAGSQRFAAIWTGDNVADWQWLKISFPMCLNSNLFGIVFCGADVGGFNNNPTDELLQRWFQAGAWLPFFRSHTSSNRREPYLYSTDIQNVLREALNIRYKHLPVWYTLFFEHTRNGDPIIRPLSYHYPAESIVYEIDDQLLVGKDILVKGIFEAGVDKVQVYLPGENEIWYYLNDYTVLNGGQSETFDIDITTIPVFYRGGSIITRQDLVKGSASDMVNGCYSIYINLNKDDYAEGTVYKDDFSSFEYKNGNYSYVKISYSAKDDNIIVEPIDSEANGHFDIFICKVIVNSPISKNVLNHNKTLNVNAKSKFKVTNIS